MAPAPDSTHHAPTPTQAVPFRQTLKVNGTQIQTSFFRYWHTQRKKTRYQDWQRIDCRASAWLAVLQLKWGGLFLRQSGEHFNQSGGSLALMNYCGGFQRQRKRRILGIWFGLRGSFNAQSAERQLTL